VVIRGHLNASPATFSTTNVADIVSRTTTTASVSWLNIPTWGPNIAGANERTPDLTSIVQEIIGLPGWTSGNPMAFIISESPGAERTAHSFEGNSAAAPLLTIQYVAPASAKDWEIYE
jgi:titin